MTYKNILIVAATVFSSAVYGHGGVSVENDTCVMDISGMRAHFTGYQPDVRATQEFCEDIPELGKAIVVVDFIERTLRDMHVEFRVLEDVSGLGADAKFADLGDDDDIENNTIVSVPFARYPRGTLTFEHEFSEPGWYIGMLTARDGEKIYRSVFPFRVGVHDYTGYFVGFALVIGLSLLMYSVTTRKNFG